MDTWVNKYHYLNLSQWYSMPCSDLPLQSCPPNHPLIWACLRLIAFSEESRNRDVSAVCPCSSRWEGLEYSALSARWVWPTHILALERVCQRKLGKPEHPAVPQGQDWAVKHTYCAGWGRKARVLAFFTLVFRWSPKMIRTLGMKTSFFSNTHKTHRSRLMLNLPKESL